MRWLAFMRHKGRSENCVTSGRNLNKIGPRSSPTVRSISIGDRYTPISAGIFRLAGGKLNYQVKSTVWDYSGILSCPWYCVNSIIDLPGEISPNILFRFFNFQKSTKKHDFSLKTLKKAQFFIKKSFHNHLLNLKEDRAF